MNKIIQCLILLCITQVSHAQTAYTNVDNNFSAYQTFDSFIQTNSFLQVTTTGEMRAIRLNSIDPYIDFRSGGDSNKRFYIRAFGTNNYAYYYTSMAYHNFNTDVLINGQVMYQSI